MLADTAKRILAADDQAVMRAVLKRVLSLEGYRCDTVNNGRQAMAALAENRYDLALLDIGMPDVDGLEVLEHIRRTPELADLPVIMVTGKAELDVVERCRELGVTDYLAKPYQIAMLVERIHRRLRG
jgi:CheY-like chemotaxis protein